MMVKLVLTIIMNCISVFGLTTSDINSEVLVNKKVSIYNEVYVVSPINSKFDYCKFEQSLANLTFENKL